MAVELTDVGSVRQFMQKSISDTLQDEDIEVLILQASLEIQRHCNREFSPATAATKRSFEFVPNGNLELIDLKPYECRAVTLVTIDPDFSGGTEIPAEHWRLWPYPAKEGTYFGLRLAEVPELKLPTGFKSSKPLFPFQTRRLDVTGDWGVGDVPSAVQHWTNVTVREWAKEGISTPEPEGILPRDLPPHAAHGLRRWLRPTLSA